MRDPNRIRRILRLVKKIWHQNPNLRLTQLLGNCFKPGDLYYEEDEKVEKRLKEVYLKDEEAYR